MRSTILIGLGVVALALGGCEERNEGPAERLGERIDESLEEGRERLEEAADEFREAVDEIDDALEEE